MPTKHTSRKSPEKSAQAVEEQLATYRSMRDFKTTVEPKGGSKSTGKAAGLPFVIQKHAATRLHYDFRLGWNGVLKSWAVAKGPSYVTKDKRLAVQVEDHPIEYGGFEGIISKGQYGGGTVMVWDQGTWEPQPDHTDVDAGLRNGSLKFILHGTKMKGKWALIRMGGKAANSAKPNWLLIKEHDEFERAPSDPAITDESPSSVVTKRDLDQIASQQDHVWNSKESAKTAAAKTAPKATTKPAVKASQKPPTSDLKAFPKEKLPAFIVPQLALQAIAPSDALGWLHELKLDGYRIQAVISAGKHGTQVQLKTRTGLDWTGRMPTLATALAKFPAEQAILDGEVVVLSKDGTTSFANLQAAFQDGAKHDLTYFVFDLLHLNGHDLRGAPLIQRKQILANLLANVESNIRFSEHIDGGGIQVFEKACDLHAEGIISKRVSSPYQSGRSGSWLKVKCKRQQEFVIGGFTQPSNGGHGIGALLLGYYNNSQKLVYAGRTGTGFTQMLHRSVRAKLDPLAMKTNPFAAIPYAAARGVTWVKPTLVAQVEFATWTADLLVRQAAFKGLREDKPAAEVRREQPITPAPRKAAAATHKSQNAVAAKTAPAAAKSVALPPAIHLTYPEKILDPDSSLTKQQLANYYWAIAESMLPEIANRPISLVRCPEGSEKPCFFQKHTNAMLPKSIETIDVIDKKSGKPEPYITLSTPEALTSLAQMGVLEIHPWSSRNSDLEHPDRIIIDLDPDSAITWTTLAESANEVRALFTSLGLQSFLKSTGGKGLHIVVPILPEHDWATVKGFAHDIALHLEKKQPGLYLSKMSRAARKNHIYVDYLRNERGATAVAAYSPRARTGAPVSMPLDWKELDLPERPVFHVSDFDGWKARLKRNPWKTLPKIQQSLSEKFRP